MKDALVDDETTEVKGHGTTELVTQDSDGSDDDDDREDGVPSSSWSDHHHQHHDVPSLPTQQHLSYHPRIRIPQIIAAASWYELSGSLGDLGTFLPLVTALGQARAIHVGPVLVYAGLANIVTGYVWDCPMPVQPMKSIAATALYAAWSTQTVTAAGMWMGLALTILAAFPEGLTWLAALVPVSVVAGMQVGVGLSLAIHGLEWLRHLPLWGLDSIALGLLCGAMTLVTLRPPNGSNRSNNGTLASGRPPPPMALYLFGLASVLAIVQLHTRADDDDDDSSMTMTNDDDTVIPGAHVWGVWALKGITAQDISKGLWEGAIPQLPLTLLNSVVSVCCLADSLFPERRRYEQHNSSSFQLQVLPPREVAASIGCINLLACPFGGLPVCHGAGGLAAQHKFGARHGTSIVILGICKIMAAVVAGPMRLLRFLDALPLSILAVLILVAGHELALTGLASILPQDNSRFERHEERLEEERLEDDNNENDENINDYPHQISSIRNEVSVCLWTAAIIVGLHKTHYGALTGCVAYIIQRQGYVRLQAALRGWLQHVTVGQTAV